MSEGNRKRETGVGEREKGGERRREGEGVVWAINQTID